MDIRAYELLKENNEGITELLGKFDSLIDALVKEDKQEEEKEDEEK